MDNVVAEAKTNDSSGSDETDTKSGYFSDDWIFENKQIIRREGDRMVVYAFPGVVCYKCPFCGPQSQARTFSGQARHFGICKRRRYYDTKSKIHNPSGFRFDGIEMPKEKCKFDDKREE